jgi:1-acyl-sn-glycerol-3-phosphate acyltransferase
VSSPQHSKPHRRPSPGQIAFGLYTWLQFLLLGLLALGGLLVLPSLARRRRLVRRIARASLRLAGIRVSVGPLADLPTPCVIVANHCSYLDGAVLTAALPPCFAFVIKREMARVPLAGYLLRRIGVQFMERRAPGKLLADTRRMLRHALAGEALVFFPEGTFSREVGLMHFHIGAFAAAARARLPVVPLAIRGTRRCLAPGTIWPRPGRVRIQVLPAIFPQSAAGGRSADPAGRLRDLARTALLEVLGEPDLTATSRGTLAEALADHA